MNTSRAQLQAWLAERVAALLDRPPSEIAVEAELGDYGLDSVRAAALVAEIEDGWDLVLDPAVAWEHPSVAALASHLAELGANPR
ncbi:MULTISPECIES: acyl carrier protein [unclassified Saccharopolyspora]|uniref:acyl carrier protein n=1 Tax=unclassified Saccharopolyspora TaxID=2646250 RepID=UPI001CD2536C|nr:MULTISPECIES: acyl carrier protein [unclassified Saccharopolyspora]MCA1185130.1 acyl carrier protein [Saccharopolyspora sp. 6T]MCA1191394.1 acyl carrier protein [Saccharopolyspora sp. 6V]MCA1225005.1 acyl carrier protein [Saccharopolyspora sp. 6M]MCA1278504.1 acyl carrier protein [Saccharopolyspora sp. 7B]